MVWGAAMFLVGTVAADAQGRDASFAWSANPPPVQGYKLYYKKDGIAGPPFYGVDAEQGPSPIDVGNQTTFTLRGLADDAVYHFSLTAYNYGEESGFAPVITLAAEQETPENVSSLISAISRLLLLKKKE